MSFEPKIVSFLCNWCSYSGADLAGTSRVHYKPNVRVIRVMCSARVDPTFVVKALAEGADGVLVCGCHPGDCHYSEGNYKTMRLDVLVLMKTIGLVILNPKRRVLKRRRPSGPPDQGAVAP